MGGYLQIKARPHELHIFNNPRPNQLYQYWTLQQKGWFRVLVIEPSLDPDERISCSLLHRPLHHTTHYEALSYTWGDEKAEYPMLIDGAVFYVRRNLYCALRELRTAYKSCVLWIDAICINQVDEPERGFQVAQMGSVYSFAERVIVWLGEAYDQTKAGFDGLAEYFRISNAACMAATPDADSSDNIAKGFAEFLTLPDTDNYLFGIMAVYSRPWWRRMWTVQEVGLAREIEVCFGGWRIEWEQLYLFSTAMMFRSVQDVLARYTPRSEMGRAALMALRTHSTHRAHSMENTRSQLKKGKLSLSVLARVTLDRLATDPRDKVYGLLGMTTDDLALQPVYSLSVLEVYTATTKAILLQNRDLSIFSFLLYSNANRVLGLPSWVLDFQILTEKRSLATISNFFEGLSLRAYSATPDTSLDSEFVCEFEDNDQLLRLKGAQLDFIHSIGKCAAQPNQFITDTAQESLLSTITQWKSCVPSMHKPYFTRETSLAAFWKTLVIDRQIVGYHSGFSGEAREEKNKRLSKTDSSIPPRTLQDEKLLARALLSPGGQVSHLCNRRFAVSEKGFYALLPGTAREGDVLYVLNGGEVPFVLRPLANGRFQMLGECYVHGMMDGEARTFTYQRITLE